MDTVEIILEEGKEYHIELEGFLLMTLWVDEYFVHLADYSETPIMRLNKRAIPYLKTLKDQKGTPTEKSDPSH